MDAQNTLRQHLIVGIFSLSLVSAFRYLLGIEWSTSFARVSFILLFLILIIGPIMRVRKTEKCPSPLLAPWSWRGELGIWFATMALAHFVFVLMHRPLSELIKIGGEGYGLANLLGLVALIWALMLTVTSFGRVIAFLGLDLWKWFNSFTYVIFYLVSAHYLYFQFFSTYGGVGPDWFGYMAVAMSSIVIILQLGVFVLMAAKHRKNACSS